MVVEHTHVVGLKLWNKDWTHSIYIYLMQNQFMSSSSLRCHFLCTRHPPQYVENANVARLEMSNGCANPELTSGLGIGLSICLIACIYTDLKGLINMVMVHLCHPVLFSYKYGVRSLLSSTRHILLIYLMCLNLHTLRVCLVPMFGHRSQGRSQLFVKGGLLIWIQQFQIYFSIKSSSFFLSFFLLSFLFKGVPTPGTPPWIRPWVIRLHR